MLSKLLKQLYEESNYSSIASLSQATGVDKGFIDRVFSGKHTMERLDPLFEELTTGLTVEDFILCIRLIKQLKLNLDEQT